MGLGAWIFCGFFDDILMGAYPGIAKGFGFTCEPLNSKAPAAMGALKIFGLEGVKEGTYVPSPRYKNGTEVVKQMLEEKYGHGATMANDESNWILTHGGPFKPDVIREIAKDPAVHVCVVGTQEQACGTGGGACRACDPERTCVAGICL